MPALSARMLPQRATIYRTATVSSSGDYIRQRAALASNVPCRLVSASLPRVGEEAGMLVSEPMREVYFRPTQDVKPGDEMVLAGRTERLIVQSVDDQADGIYRKASLIEEQPS